MSEENFLNSCYEIKHSSHHSDLLLLQLNGAKTIQNHVNDYTSGKSDVLTAILCAKVHSHRSFAHAIFDKYYKIFLKRSQKISPNARGVRKRPRRRKRYRTAVKVPSASTLWTRVRATVVFSNLISEKRFSFEHVCELSRFLGRLLTFSRVL